MLFGNDKKPGFLKIRARTWRNDLRLRACSFEARALFIELCLIMIEGSPYGHARINGNTLKIERIAAMVGMPADRCEALMDELLMARLVYQDYQGCYLIPEMIHARERAKQNAINASHGAKKGFARMVELYTQRVNSTPAQINTVPIPTMPTIDVAAQMSSTKTEELNTGAGLTDLQMALMDFEKEQHGGAARNLQNVENQMQNNQPAARGSSAKKKSPTSYIDNNIDNKYISNNNTTINNKGEKKFKKPTATEVADYMREIQYPGDCTLESEQFISFYTSKGWKVGKTGMKDWQAAVRTWKLRKQGSSSTNKNITRGANEEQF